MEMIESGAHLLGGQIELVQDMDFDRITTVQIIIHLEPEKEIEESR